MKKDNTRNRRIFITVDKNEQKESKMKEELYFKRLVNTENGEVKAEPSYGYRIDGVERCFFVEEIAPKRWIITERDTGAFCHAASSWKGAKEWVITHEKLVNKVINSSTLSDLKEHQDFYKKSLKTYKELTENDTEENC